MRAACSQVVYMSKNQDEITLMDDTSAISECMTKMLQKRVQVAGYKIQQMAIMEISYTPEMNQALL